MEEATKKTRDMGRIIVEKLIDDNWVEQESGPHETSASAEKWVREKAAEGDTYRVIREVRVMKAKIETKKVVRFADED